jgi:hypothetical protein
MLHARICSDSTDSADALRLNEFNLLELCETKSGLRSIDVLLDSPDIRTTTQVWTRIETSREGDDYPKLRFPFEHCEIVLAGDSERCVLSRISDAKAD